MEIPIKVNIFKIISVGKAVINGKMEHNIEEIFLEESDLVREFGNRNQIRKDCLIDTKDNMILGKRMALENTNGAMASYMRDFSRMTKSTGKEQ